MIDAQIHQAARSKPRTVQVEIDGQQVRIHRQSEGGYQVVEGTLSAVIGVVEKINEPRYPSFTVIMAAKKPVQTISLADAGIDPVGSVPAADCPDLTALLASIRSVVDKHRFDGLTACDTRRSILTTPPSCTPPRPAGSTAPGSKKNCSASTC
jgi:hypothetical protein